MNLQQRLPISVPASVNVALYYLEKAQHAFRSGLAGRVGSLRLKREPGKVYGGAADFRYQGKLVFLFHPASLFHLGDQLFHHPIVKGLASSCEVHVVTAPTLGAYFEALGARVWNPAELSSEAWTELLTGAVVITKNDLADLVYRLAGPKREQVFFIGLDYGALSSQERIAVSVTREILSVLESQGWLPQVPGLEVLEAAMTLDFKVPVQISEAPPLNQAPGWLAQLRANPGARYIVFNDFVASNHLQAWRRHGLILEMARKKRAEGFKIIYAGSPAEKNISRPGVDFIDWDLRGEVRALDLFKLFALPEVVGLISYDTFIAHVASLMRKDLYIVMKNERRASSYRRKFIPMFPVSEPIVKACL